MTKFDNIRDNINIIESFLDGEIGNLDVAMDSAKSINSLLDGLTNRQIADEFDMTEEEVEEEFEEDEDDEE